MPTPDDVNWYSNESATFGDRVAAAREVLGMDQKTLARRLGVALKTVEAWEQDLSEPRANKLQMLSGILNVSMTWLLTGEGDGLAAQDVPEAPEVGAIMADMRALHGQMHQAVERLAVLEKRLKKALEAAE